MINWLKMLFHWPVWVDVEKRNLEVIYHDSNGNGKGLIVYQKCSVCNKYRKVVLF